MTQLLLKLQDKETARMKTKHKVCQKDMDARWTKKRGETYYGYKDHVKVDSGSKLITDYSVTDAAVHEE